MEKMRFLKLFLLVCFMSILTECQKVINIDLNSASPQTVVQGNLFSFGGLSGDSVQLSQTVNFSEPNSFPPITDALVIISDNAGNIDTLPETGSGIYTSSKIKDIPGRTYSLYISANGKTYTSISTMPAPVNIDTIYVQKSIFGKNLQITVKWTDPAGIPNYYRLIKKINNTISTADYVTDDELEDGKVITFPLFGGDNDSLRVGDSVRVYLESIDKGAYDYFISLDDASGSPGDVAPANPQSNISNNALGYFSAGSITSKSIIVP